MVLVLLLWVFLLPVYVCGLLDLVGFLLLLVILFPIVWCGGLGCGIAFVLFSLFLLGLFAWLVALILRLLILDGVLLFIDILYFHIFSLLLFIIIWVGFGWLGLDLFVLLWVWWFAGWCFTCFVGGFEFGCVGFFIGWFDLALSLLLCFRFWVGFDLLCLEFGIRVVWFTSGCVLGLLRSCCFIIS